MLRRLRELHPATVIAAIALFVALGGTATAITLITGKNVKDGSLSGADIKDRSLSGTDIQDGSLTNADLRVGTLAGARGPAGPEGPAGARGEAGARGPLGAQGPRGQSPWDPLPSGQMITGAQRVFLEVGATPGKLEVTVPFPAPAPVALTGAKVNFASISVDSGDKAGAFDCAGTPSVPTAPPGQVCIYSDVSDNVLDGSAFGDAVPLQPASGFTVSWNVTELPATTTNTGMQFSWAYTAP